MKKYSIASVVLALSVSLFSTNAHAWWMWTAFDALHDGGGVTGEIVATVFVALPNGRHTSTGQIDLLPPSQLCAKGSTASAAYAAAFQAVVAAGPGPVDGPDQACQKKIFGTSMNTIYVGPAKACTAFGGASGYTCMSAAVFYPLQTKWIKCQETFNYTGPSEAAIDGLVLAAQKLEGSACAPIAASANGTHADRKPASSGK